ncbi:MAG TPA: hypothetical protein VIR30_16150 [Nocardioides sp.]
MIIVDDGLSLDALAGRRSRFGAADEDKVATTWGFHYRLIRALSDTERTGRLSGGHPETLLQEALHPRPNDLEVLDPREVTGAAAAIAVRHGLNLLAAELVASAAHHDATVALSSANVGRAWPAVLETEGVTLRIVD